MTSFSRLADELILETWQYVYVPEDVESFALASKRIHRLASSFLQQHRALKQKYFTCANVGITTVDGLGQVHTSALANNSLSELLRTVLLEPRIGLYIKQFRRQGWFTTWQPQEYVDSVSTERFHIPPKTSLCSKTRCPHYSCHKGSTSGPRRSRVGTRTRY